LWAASTLAASARDDFFGVHSQYNDQLANRLTEKLTNEAKK
jgi:hypothetical protein